MALSITPAATGTVLTFTPVAGSDRFVCMELRAEDGSTPTMTACTYGPAGPAAFRIESRPLPGNQLQAHYAWFNEADIAARTSDVITPTFDAGTPTFTTYVQQFNNVDQSLPINDLVEVSNSAGSPASLPTINALDGGLIVLSEGSGVGGATFTFIDYTQQNSQGGGAYTWVVANQAIVTAGSFNTEYDESGANRSSLLAYSLNEVGSVGVGIATVNAGTPISPGDNNIIITGTKFEAVQGTAKVTLSPTDNVNDVLAVDITSVDSWADTSIQLDIDSALSLLYGQIFVFVTNDSAEVNPNGFSVTLEPPTGRSFVTIFEQHDEGILAGVTGLELGSDQIEWETLSSGGGTVYVGISGTVYIYSYPDAVPDSDTIFVRLGDASDQTWSTGAPEALSINGQGGGSGPISGVTIAGETITGVTISAETI